MSTKHLYEVAFSEAPEVDREKGIIRNVKILGPVSLNGRRYTEEAIKKAAPMYEGRHVNVDHSTDFDEKPRGVMEQVGVIKNPTIGEGGGIYADLHMLTSHISAPALMERAEKFPKSFGLSHDAQGTVTENEEGVDIVSEITAVNSVDFVSEPATNSGLYESHTNKKRPKMKKSLREVFKKAAKKSPLAKAILEAEGDDEELKKALDTEATPEIDAAAVEDPPEEEKVEEEDPVLDIPVVDEPAAPVDPSDPTEAVRAAISAKIMTIVNDKKMDAPGQIAAIKKLLVARDKVTAEMGTLVADAVEARVKPLEAKLDLLLESKKVPPQVGRKYEVTETDGKFKSMDQIFD